VKALRISGISSRIDLLRRLPPGVGVEVGVYRGAFSRQILTHAAVEQLWLVDPWDWAAAVTNDAPYRHLIADDECYQFVLARFSGDPRVRVLRLRSIEAATSFADASLAWAYIDANHTEHCVGDDLRAWAAKIKPGGVLSGHDWNWRGVRRAVTRFVAEYTEYHLCLTDDRNPSWWFRV
jgi:hypothetical protein